VLERSLDPRTGLVPGVGAEALLDRLDSTRILIRTTTAGAVLALSLANHLVRICPNVAVDAPPIEVDLPVFGTGSLPELAARLLSSARIGRADGAGDQTSLVVAVGDPTPGADVYVSADAWSLRLGVDAHDPLTGTGPAVSAAAALAAAEVFRRLLPDLPGVRLARDFEWNLVDYRTRVWEAAPAVAPVEAVCFGAGSVGSSLVLALLLSRAEDILWSLTTTGLSRATDSSTQLGSETRACGIRSTGLRPSLGAPRSRSPLTGETALTGSNLAHPPRRWPSRR